MEIRIHDLITLSRVNGPGLRLAIYFQGCNFKCTGCINPQTHDSNMGTIYDINEIFKLILNQSPIIEGVTFTGGEPLLQKEALFSLNSYARALGLTSILSTGFEEWELKQDYKVFSRLSQEFDVIIAGRYHHSERIAKGFVGSKNKKIYCFSQIYTEFDILNKPNVEIEIFNGKIRASGTGIHDLIDWSTF